MLTCIVRFESGTYRRLAHIAEKLSATRVRRTGCEDARTKRLPRDFAWPHSGGEAWSVPVWEPVRAVFGHGEGWRGNGEELSILL